jgi:hypothetical protein
MTRHFFPATAALLFGLLLFSPGASAQERGPSTAEERANVVTLTRYLEREPLGQKAKDARAALIIWWTQVPDLSVTICGNFLGPIAGSKYEYEAELTTQLMFSAGAYIIEHPGTASEGNEAFLAGVEGALRAYDALIGQKPKTRHVFLDELLAKRASGTLRQYVIDTAPECRTSQTPT